MGEIGRPSVDNRLHFVKFDFYEIDRRDMIFRNVHPASRHEDSVDVQETVALLAPLIVPPCDKDCGNRPDHGRKYNRPRFNRNHFGVIPPRELIRLGLSSIHSTASRGSAQAVQRAGYTLKAPATEGLDRAA
jgi:hypothetical protein